MITVAPYLTAPEGRGGEAGKSVYLHPGHLCFSTEDVVVSTVLGSCVSVCLFDEARTAAGINHYLLPERSSRAASPRFGDVANEMLLEHFLQIGIPKSRLRAKVFGGASMAGAREGDLASRNVDAALDFLRSADIPLLARDTGGERGRKLVFRTQDSLASVRLL
jgi:chemotaxis protein CheD